MSIIARSFFCLLILTCCGAAPTTLGSDEDLANLARQLEGSRVEQVRATKRLASLVKTRPELLARAPQVWCDPLIHTKRFKHLLAYVQRVIEQRAEDTDAVMSLQPFRARGYLYQGGWEKALFEAKGMYNVCTLDQMDKAIDLMVECLRDVHRGKPEIIEQFKLEQVRGATSSDGLGSEVLRSVKRLKRYDDNANALKMIEGNDYRSLKRQGNLLLLNDDIDEARKRFEAAYQIADDKDLAEATESLARVMKAQDGTSGRAQAWLKSQRK
jgi:hypothetical protein